MSVVAPQEQLSRGPRTLLVNDEGKAALHFLDSESPARNWVHQGAGRDLQLIGQQRLLRSHPEGYVELDLAARGAVVRQIAIAGVPGPIESARRLVSGNTVVAGNGAGGIFVWECDPSGRPLDVPEHRRHFQGIDKVRMLRLTETGTFLFCSETEGKSVIHELGWDQPLVTLFEVPDHVPADSMVKAVRVSRDILTVSTGYAASLLKIDTARKQVVQTIGGKAQEQPADASRPLSPFFFSGYQMLASGDTLISNWQGHSAERNGQGYQLLQYDSAGALVWFFDQAAFPAMSSLNNVIALDGLDTARLHDEPNGVLVPVD